MGTHGAMYLESNFNKLSFQVVHKKLMACLNHLVPKSAEAIDVGATNGAHRTLWYPTKEVSQESLIIGALEAAFWEMDHQIGKY